MCLLFLFLIEYKKSISIFFFVEIIQEVDLMFSQAITSYFMQALYVTAVDLL